jgi:hypothetical protein
VQAVDADDDGRDVVGRAARQGGFDKAAAGGFGRGGTRQQFGDAGGRSRSR